MRRKIFQSALRVRIRPKFFSVAENFYFRAKKIGESLAEKFLNGQLFILQVIFAMIPLTTLNSIFFMRSVL